MNFCVRQGWLSVNPFTRGEALIDKTAENSRDRVMSFEEEAHLLAVCVGRLAHLRPLIIVAVDSGLRKGELLKLEWRDVDFAARSINLRALITKTNKARAVTMTDRVHDELRRLWQASTNDQGELVFGIKDNFSNAWRSACKAADITNLKFHDLRHTFVSRLIAAGIQHTEAMKLSGHQTLGMLNRYLNVNVEAGRRAADALDRYRREATGDGFGEMKTEAIN